jgi:hypothetical protein
LVFATAYSSALSTPLLEELVELAQWVRRSVARLDLDRKRKVHGYDEIIAPILDFDVSPEGDMI